MIETKEVFDLVREEVSSIVQGSPTMDRLIGEMKKMVVVAMTKRGLSVEEAVGIAAKLIVLASIVRD